MPSHSGKVVLASAGSGKTTWIAGEVRNNLGARVLITTYTTNNSTHVKEKLWKEVGHLPEQVRVRTWYSFLLEDLVRPFQNMTGRTRRVAGVNLPDGISAKFKAKSDWRYWFDSASCIYTDKMAEFAMWCDDASEGAVLRRLARLYDHIYIDEVQDAAGYDLDLVERMLKAKIPVSMVGDPRQATYFVNLSPKNARFRGEAIGEKFAAWEKRNLCEVVVHNHSYRCRPEICRLADHLFPKYPAINSMNADVTEHDGVFLVRPEHVDAYVALYRPAILRWNSAVKCLGHDAMNFGASKGLQFERVLVFPTDKYRKWVSTGDISHVTGEPLSKLYVAVTRARQSVGFVYDGKCVGLGNLIRGHWMPG